MHDRVDGVNVIGYFEEPSGLGEIARLVVRTLETAGIAHNTVTVGQQPITKRMHRRQQPRYGTNIVCVNARELPTLVGTLGASLFRENRTIGFWWWEVDRFPPSSAIAAHIVDEVWVGSRHVHGAVRAATEKPTTVFPVPVLLRSTDPIDLASLGLPPDRFMFLFSFNFASAFERKNPLDLITAFKQAFSVDDGALLVLKAINGKRWPRQRTAVELAVNGRPDIILLDRSMSSTQYHGLVASCGAYVSLHRTEGFGLTIAEAMALGKPTIATGYSGNLEFMTDDNSYLIPYTLTSIPPGVSPYPPGSRWASPDVEAASAVMRTVLDVPAEARRRGGQARSDLRTGHSLEQASRFVADRLHHAPPDSDEPTDPLTRAASELAWGPDLERARPWVRRSRSILAPLLRPYLEHEREVAALLLEAMRERDRTTEKTKGGAG